MGSLALAGSGMASLSGLPPVEAAPAPSPSGGWVSRLPLPPRDSPGFADPSEFGAAEARALMARGELGAVELLEAHLSRIDRFEEWYRAFNIVLMEDARESARNSRGSGGLLDGIPLVLKDNFYTRGVLTTANSHVFEGFIPPFDATTVRRIRETGAVVLGKTQMGPLATTRALTSDGDITTVNAWTPHDPGVNPGGSSTGTATAVAARLAMVGTGTQTGGSITGPAVAQGLTGVKPTMGRVSLHGIIPLSYTRDHPGPIARSALDAALLLQVMAGPDPRDPRTLGLPPVPDYLAAATPRVDARIPWPTRIGVPTGWDRLLGERGAARRAFLQTLEECGATLTEVRYPESWTLLASPAFNNVRLVERAEPFLEALRDDVRRFGVALSSWINGLLLSGDEYLKGQRARYALLKLILDEVFADCDLILQESHLPFDAVGLPLIAFPIGFRSTRSGRLPEGAILGGLPFGEERLLAVAAAWQARTRWHLERPEDPSSQRGRPDPIGDRGALDVEEVAELAQ